MRLSTLTPSIVCVAALVGGCAHTAAPAGASARVVCKDGTQHTENGECGGRGGIDHQATRQKSQALRDSQVSGAAAAGKPDEVWAAPAAKVYYCHGDPGYGSAKEGKFMSESEAAAKGLHAAHGKHCG